jgi:hypothetical protein
LLTSDGTSGNSANAEANLTFDGTRLSLTGEFYYNSENLSADNSASPYRIHTTTITGLSGAFYDYTVRSSTTTACRIGSIYVIWSGTDVVFTDTSTVDLGSTTSDVKFTAQSTGTNIELWVDIASGDWDVTVGVRLL